MTGMSPPLSSKQGFTLPWSVTAKGGFTLIELLIVVAILAILAVVVVITLNPAQLIKQARDSTRLQDIGAINRVIGLYQADGGISFGTSSIVYVSIPDPAATTTSGTNCSTMGLPTLPPGWAYHCAASSTYRNINGFGWIPVNFTQISFGNPLPNLPVDPINTTSTGEYYTYATGESWELTTLIESDKYADIAVNDGDSYPGVYSKRTSAVSFTPGTRDKGMVGYWRFDEGSGTTASDASGNGNTGQLNGGSSWTTGKISNALSFDGNSGSYVNVTSSATLNTPSAATIAAWIYPRAQDGIRIGMSLSGNTGDQRFLLHDYGGYNLSIVVGNSGGTTQFLDSTQEPPNNQWSHIAATSDGSYLRVYLNGVQIASTSQTVTPYMSGINFYIGGKGIGATPWFNGIMDDIRFYNRALSAAEISAIYNATK